MEPVRRSAFSKLLPFLVLALVLAAGAAYWWFNRPGTGYQSKDAGVFPVISSDGKVGLIDVDGNVVVPPTWQDSEGRVAFVNDEPVEFSEGLMSVMKDNKYGYVDTHGQLVIPTQFESASPFVEGFAAVSISDASGKNLYGFIDKTGHYVINPQFQGVGYFQDGLANVQSDRGWGFVDRTGKYIIDPNFRSAGVFSEGLASVGQVGQKGYIGRTGKFEIPPQFQDAGRFSEGLAVARIGGKFGYIDKSGKFVINPQFDLGYPFVNGVAIVNINSNHGVIDKNGKFVINPGQFKFIQVGFPSRLLKIWTSDGAGIMTRGGKWVLPPNPAIQSIGHVYEKVFTCTLNGEFESIFVTLSGKILSGKYKGSTLVSALQSIAKERAATEAAAEKEVAAKLDHANSLYQLGQYKAALSECDEILKLRPSNEQATKLRVYTGATGYWKMDKTSGSTVVDSSGNNNNGTLYGGSTFVAGKFGNAISFNGINGYISMPSVITSSGWTINAWIKLNSTSDMARVYRFGVQSGCNPSTVWFIVSQQNMNLGVGCADSIALHPATNIQLGTWYMATAVWDTNNLANLYLNGQLIAGPSNITGGQSISYSGGNQEVGAEWSGGTHSFSSSQIDELRVYNRALSASEISTLYGGK